MNEAATPGDVLHRWTARLVRRVACRLFSEARVLLDPEDVVQSVFRSFLESHHGDAWGRVPTEPDAVWAMLARRVDCKVSHKLRYLFAQRRDARLLESLRPEFQALDPEPTPEEEAELRDEVARVLDGLRDTDRQIVSLLMQGHRPGEVAASLGVSDRSVRRAVERARDLAGGLGGG